MTVTTNSVSSFTPYFYIHTYAAFPQEANHYPCSYRPFFHADLQCSRSEAALIISATVRYCVSSSSDPRMNGPSFSKSSMRYCLRLRFSSILSIRPRNLNLRGIIILITSNVRFFASSGIVFPVICESILELVSLILHSISSIMNYALDP